MIEVGKVKVGQFKAEFFSGSLSHALSPSSPLTISPAEGKTLRLDSLYGAATISGVTVTVGGVAVIANKVLSDQVSGVDGQFTVSSVGGVSSQSATTNVSTPLIAFEADQSITISATSASGTIKYSYSYGE